MQGNEDYYSILQVHHLAEPEVIESAYRRLAKKYHPDVNRSQNSDERMKAINRAYAVLCDPGKRRQYDLRRKGQDSGRSDWSRRNSQEGNALSVIAAKAILNEYFKSLRQNHFDCAYELISERDKRKISREDFQTWQSSVSEIFRLTEYDLSVGRMARNKGVGGQLFSETAEFIVSVAEHNMITDMLERNTFTKTVVLENKKWGVYLGYNNLQPLIEKFKSLYGLLAAKPVLGELAETHSRIDGLTGHLNQRGILEKINCEAYRSERYGNEFSLILAEVQIENRLPSDMRGKAEECAVKVMGEVLSNSLRRIDAIGRWERKSFLILLPETGRDSAVEVAQKISKTLNQKICLYDDKALSLSLRFKTVEYDSDWQNSWIELKQNVDV